MLRLKLFGIPGLAVGRIHISCFCLIDDVLFENGNLGHAFRRVFNFAGQLVVFFSPHTPGRFTTPDIAVRKFPAASPTLSKSEKNYRTNDLCLTMPRPYNKYKAAYPIVSHQRRVPPSASAHRASAFRIWMREPETAMRSARIICPNTRLRLRMEVPTLSARTCFP